MDDDLNWRVIRVRLFEMGHSFDEIDNLGVQDVGDIIGYWTGKAKADEKRNKGASSKGNKKGRR